METAGLKGMPGNYINMVDGDNGGYLLTSSTHPALNQGTGKNPYDVDFGDDYDVDFGSQGGYAYVPVAAEGAHLSAADAGVVVDPGTGYAFLESNSGAAKQNSGYDLNHPDAGAVV